MTGSTSELSGFPVMSGALQSNATGPQSTNVSNNQSPDDQIYSDHSRNLENQGPLAPFPPIIFTTPIQNFHSGPNESGTPYRANNIHASRTYSTLQSRQSILEYRRQARQSSPDEILRYGSNRYPVPEQEAQIPLPESRSSGTPTEYSRSVSGNEQPKSSFEIITEKGIPYRSSGPFPSSIPLLEPGAQSKEAGRSKPKPHTRSADHQTPIQEHNPQQERKARTSAATQWSPSSQYPYEDMIKRASGFLSHIEHGQISSQARHELFDNISYIDYSWVPGAVCNAYRLHSQHEMSFFVTLGTIPDHVRQRIVVVEDLCPRTINLLGTLFGISPEFFEEHLINSGFGGANYDDPPSHTWTTSGMKKSFISMRWHRPVVRLPVVPFSERDLNELLDPEIGRVEYRSKTSRTLRVYQTETNILRSEWALWTDPAITTTRKRFCGWEERVSVWNQKMRERDCQIGT